MSSAFAVLIGSLMLLQTAHAQSTSFADLEARGLRLVTSFAFARADGAELSAVVGGATPLRWSKAMTNTRTVLNEGLVIQKPVGSGTEERDGELSIVDIPAIRGAKAVWLFLELGGWSFGDSSTRNIYIGFGQRGDRLSAVTQMRFRGNSRAVDLNYEAISEAEGATSGRPVKIGAAEEFTAQSYALEYREAERIYALYRVEANGRLEKLGEGKTSPKRSARTLHLLVRGGFNADLMESFTVRSVTVAVIPQ